MHNHVSTEVAVVVAVGAVGAVRMRGAGPPSAEDRVRARCDVRHMTVITFNTVIFV